MSYLPTKVFTDSIASGASTSGGTVISEGYSNYLVQVASMSTAAAISIQHSADAGTTWYNVYAVVPNTSTVAANLVTIASAVGNVGGVAALPIGGLRQIRFLATAVVSGGVGFKIICSD